MVENTSGGGSEPAGQMNSSIMLEGWAAVGWTTEGRLEILHTQHQVNCMVVENTSGRGSEPAGQMEGSIMLEGWAAVQ